MRVYNLLCIFVFSSIFLGGNNFGIWAGKVDVVSELIEVSSGKITKLTRGKQLAINLTKDDSYETVIAKLKQTRSESFDKGNANKINLTEENTSYYEDLLSKLESIRNRSFDREPCVVSLGGKKPFPYTVMDDSNAFDDAKDVILEGDTRIFINYFSIVNPPKP